MIFVSLWGAGPIKSRLERATLPVEVPWLHNQVQRMPPAVQAAAPLPAVFQFNWLSAAGTACWLAAVLGGFVAGLGIRAQARVLRKAARQLAMPTLTIVCVLGLAFVMNYAGLIATLGLAFAATGWCFPFFSAVLGWLGVFVTGSNTSSNALFGNLQVVAAGSLGLNPLLTTAVAGSCRRDGKDDLAAKHRRGAGRDRAAAIARKPTVPLGPMAQPDPDRRGRRTCHALRPPYSPGHAMKVTLAYGREGLAVDLPPDMPDRAGKVHARPGRRTGGDPRRAAATDRLRAPGRQGPAG